ncbi:hypothetical protein Hanom_Chr01g00002341 [Helianthus anomalus]
MSLLTLLFFIFLILSSPPLISSTIPPPTAYEALESYGFPPGLLPVGVTGYTLDEQTGNFEVYIGQTCKYTVQGYNLKYESTISGVISQNKLTKLKGISVKVLFVWLSIVEVSRDGDELYLSVGILSAAFDITGFVESPQCGCGFDCNDVASVEIKEDGLRSVW